jgi:GUN4-like
VHNVTVMQVGRSVYECMHACLLTCVRPTFFRYCLLSSLLISPSTITAVVNIRCYNRCACNRTFCYCDGSSIQFTRDALIELSGAKAKGRNFVYFTDVKNIPAVDLATIERLWSQFSGGKFGYSVQKRKWKQSKGDFEVFCRKIGWTTKDGEVERKKRWFGASEFIYNVKKAPEGHLPLTSALRGTSLLKELLNHPVWDNEDWKKEP